ncbi:YheC/YheD family protein [Lederbergia wuyishanensis]|uniref:LAGLIDADG homing endonuclease n=1 Tax=Lederbergia wuyishanensis TaxID=1347903 RepID=A0ABU0D5C9_9BACI|nr:YheC/YheD family protein [Lederbergia wuyishanensis]MCJ8009856.1 hypothetical protein [Lederbergia wuyishanensis]MDQ0343607.1 hypothetical protein [Lederbergia wuyishanensis]
MSEIGLLYPKGRLSKEDLYQLYGQVASNLGVDLVFFTKETINWSSKTIKGHIYNDGSWRKKNSSLPNSIIVANENIMNEVNSQLRELIVPFPTLGYLGKNKWTIYEKLQNREFQYDLIPLVKIRSSGQFLRILKEYRKVVIKPTFDTYQYLIEQKGNHYIVTGKGEVREKSQEELRSFIKTLQKQEENIVQPHLLFRTKDGEAFNIEVNLKKDEGKKWVIHNIVPRFYLRNVQKFTGYKDISSFLKSHSPYNSTQFIQNIWDFSIDFVEKLERVYKETNELSLYLKMDDLHKIWVDEIKWNIEEVDIVKRHLKDALSLQKRKERLK